MPVRELFLTRQQRLRGEVPDVYRYDEIPQPFRVQFVQIMQATLGGGNHIIIKNSKRANIYRDTVLILRREFGLFVLPPTKVSGVDYASELCEYILHEQSVEHVLSAVDLVCSAISRLSGIDGPPIDHRAEVISVDAIQEINARFAQHGLGFEYNGVLVRKDSELMHAEAVKPALSILRSSVFAGAEQEFLSAYEHYRNGNGKEALNEALKAFESTMKSIYTKRGWSYGKTDTAAKLIKVAFDNGLVPAFWESHFSGLRATLEAGVPTARNKLSGHGQGAVPTEIPPYLVSYALHMTASTILFLAKAEEDLA